MLHNANINNSLTQRQCCSCKKIKSLSEFHKNKYLTLGRLYVCKTCVSEKGAEKRKNFSEERKNKIKNNSRNYKKSDSGKVNSIISSYKTIDKKSKRGFDLTKEYVTSVFLNKDCTYCGFPAIGLDRLDNSKGHIQGNVVPCCKECNIARNNNFSVEEMFLIGKTIRKIKRQRIKNN